MTRYILHREDLRAQPFQPVTNDPCGNLAPIVASDLEGNHFPEKQSRQYIQDIIAIQALAGLIASRSVMY
jgi:hypothetical protein